MLTQLLNHVSKEQCSRGEYTKKRCPRQRKFIDGGLFRALNGAGAWPEAGAGVEKKTPHPGRLTGAGRGIGAGACRFLGPRGPLTNTNPQSTDTVSRRGRLLCWYCTASYQGVCLPLCPGPLQQVQRSTLFVAPLVGFCYSFCGLSWRY